MCKAGQQRLASDVDADGEGTALLQQLRDVTAARADVDHDFARDLDVVTIKRGLSCWHHREQGFEKGIALVPP